MIRADSREKDPVIKAAADEVALLHYANPQNPNVLYSFDIEVTTAGGQTLRFERKAAGDFVSSFLAGKLDRQVSAVDALVVEWSDLALVAAMPDGDAARVKWMRGMEAARSHLARLSLAMPVIITNGPHETVARLKYLEAQEGELDLFENRVKVRGDTVAQALVNCLPGINGKYRLKDGRTRFEAIWDCVDVDALLGALGVSQWHDRAGVPKGVVSNIIDQIAVVGAGP